MKKWHIIIYTPAYNVEKSISELVERLHQTINEPSKSKLILKSLIIVNDGSTDSTRAILSDLSAKFSYLRIVNKKSNEGPAKALFSGMQEVLSVLENSKQPLEKIIVVRMDSDLEHQPEDVPKLLAPIISGNAKISVGYDPFDVRMGLVSNWFNKIAGLNGSRKFLDMDIPQFCPGFNAIRADVFKKIHSKLLEEAKKFYKITGNDLLTIDFVILVVAKQFGEKIFAVKNSFIGEKWIKKPPVRKILRYLDYHRKTMSFLEKETKSS